MIKISPKKQETVDAIWRLEKLILNSLDFNQVVQEICDGILHELGYLKLGYEIVVLTLVNEHHTKLQRVAISKTQKAREAISKSPIPFKEIDVSLRNPDNILIQAMKKKKSFHTKDWKDILTPASTDENARALQKSLKIKSSLVFPVISQNRALGALIFSMTKSPSSVTDGERELLESFSDIVGLAVQNAALYSQLDQANVHLKKANNDLRHLDKLKDEFVYVATHELKTPVTVMKGFISMINDGQFGAINPELADALNEIDKANLQLIKLVNDLLEIARNEVASTTVETRKVNICEVVEETVNNIRPLAEQKKLQLEYSCPSRHHLVIGDADRLREILNNLLSNAIKYSEQGTISVDHVVEKDQLITHVKDQGVGLSEEDQKHIFTRFFRAEEQANKVPGTGLGSFIVKQLVEKMGGRIWFQSKLGAGTTFSFSLPLAKA